MSNFKTSFDFVKKRNKKEQNYIRIVLFYVVQSKITNRGIRYIMPKFVLGERDVKEDRRFSWLYDR